MGSITSWLRLEPRCRDDDMMQAVQARLYDPLWLLARQWQVGEFEGEDTGSPVLARWRAQTTPLTRFHAGAMAPNSRVAASRYDVAALPLEAMVERQPVRAVGPLDEKRSMRLAVESGQHFLRVLDAQATSASYRAAFVEHFALASPTAQQRAQADAQTLSWWDLMAGRVPDGRRLALALRGPERNALTDAMQVAPGDRAEVDKALSDWLASHDALFTEPPAGRDAWNAERMEYAFAVAGALQEGETALAAAEYFEGHLDWHSVDIDLEVNLGSADDAAATGIVRTVVPAPVTFRGAPAQRFWEFEDARIDYGLMPAGPGDLPQLMLSEFATSFGNDWYVVPIDLPVGSLTRTRSLLIVDTFGVQTLVRPVNDSGSPRTGWSMFELAHLQRSDDAGAPLRPASNLFYLAPSLWKAIEGRATEEVLFMRDEMANMAWAVEQAVQGQLEQRLDMNAPATASPSSVTGTAPPASSAEGGETPSTESGLPRYRLATDVPSNWIPLLPQRRTLADGTSQLRLVRAAMLAPDGSNAVRSARSELLRTAGNGLALYDEEIPREGMRVTRSFQLTRWIGGSTQLWLGYRKQAGRGEGASGLRFDDLES